MTTSERQPQDAPHDTVISEHSQHGPPRPAFFRQGEVVLLFEPLAAARRSSRQALTGRPIASLADAFGRPSSTDAEIREALQTALKAHAVDVTATGTSLLLNRGGDPYLMQVVFVDGRQDSTPLSGQRSESEYRRQFTSVRQAVKDLHRALNEREPRANIVVGDYRLVGASPNWLTTPFFNGV